MTIRAPGPARRNAWRVGIAAVAVVAVVLGGILLAIAAFPTDDENETDAPAGAADPIRVGYVPYWDQARGFDVVRANLDLFDEVSPVWYSLEPNGDVVLADDEFVNVNQEAVRWLQDSGIRVIPTATNLRNGEWSPELVHQMLHDPEAMRNHVRQLVDLAVREGYDGIDIDYESLGADDREPFTTFVRELGAALHAEDKVLTVDLHPKTSDEGSGEHNIAQDYQAIGEVADQVRLMAYDYSWATSPPGPVAPAAWVESVVAWTVTQIPAEKVILGIVLLGYDWSEGVGETVEYQQAEETRSEQGADLRRANDGSPWYRYQDADGVNHEVWYEDAASVEPKLALVYRYGLGGAFFWRLGGEDPEIWPAVSERM